MEKLNNESEHAFNSASLSFGIDEPYTMIDSSPITTENIIINNNSTWELNAKMDDSSHYFEANSSDYFEYNISLT